ncbi:MAG: VCBS repeat-containing protein [Acidobacteriota bacterium]
MTSLDIRLACLAVLLPLTSQAVVVPGPDDYSWRNRSSGCRVVDDPLSHPDVASFLDGGMEPLDIVGPIELGFSMPYFDGFVERVWVHRNGVVTFEDPTPVLDVLEESHHVPPTIFGPAIPLSRGFIALHWTTLVHGSDSVSWTSADGHFQLSLQAEETSGAPVRSELHLHVGGDIRIELFAPVPEGSDATIGLAGNDAENGLLFLSEGHVIGPDELALGSPHAICFERPRLSQTACSAAVGLECGLRHVGRLTTGSDALTGYPCSGETWSGDEVVHALELDEPTRLRAELTGAGETALFLLSDCRESSCLVSDPSVVEEDLLPGRWYLVVDSRSGDDYELDLSCTPLAEPLGCGDAVLVTTEGAPSLFDHHDCHRAPLLGGDASWTLESETPGRLDLRLDDGLSSALVLVHAVDADGMGRCVATGRGGVVVHEPPPGRYSVIVDAPLGEESDGVLELSCDRQLDCERALPISAGPTLVGNTLDGEARLDRSSCEDVGLEGREQVHRIVTTPGRPLELVFLDRAPSQRMLLMRGCSEGRCIDVSQDSLVVVDPPEGEELYLVVDGPAGEEGPYEIAVSGGAFSNQEVDLRAVGLDLVDATDGDWSTLELARVALTQLGSRDLDRPFDVLIFRDDPATPDGVLGAGDEVLGRATVPMLAARSTASVDVPLTGERRFRDEPLHALVDPDDAWPDGRDDDESTSLPPSCRLVPPAADFDFVVEWHADGFNSGLGPLVGDVDGDGLPEVVAHDHSVWPNGYRIFDGLTGEQEGALDDVSGLVLVDIDEEPGLELIGTRPGTTSLFAMDHEGTELWQSEPGPERPAWPSLPALTDLDADGRHEIVFGQSVWGRDGRLLWSRVGDVPGWHAPAAIDVDGDGADDLMVTSGLGLDLTPPFTPRPLWELEREPLNAFAVAVGNLDQDPGPEVVVSGWFDAEDHAFEVLDADTGVRLVAGRVPRGSGTCPLFDEYWQRTGPALIADIDGDLMPEIVTESQEWLTAFERDGSLRWSVPVCDQSTGLTAVSGFDFDGDGAVEIVFRDEAELRVFDGRTGRTLGSFPSTHQTGIEHVVIADVDADGRAEIVLPSMDCHPDYPYNGCPENESQGVFVLGTADGGWLPTEPAWLESGHHRRTPEADGPQTPSWQSHGSWRTARSSSFVLGPDATLGLLEVELTRDDDCLRRLRVVLRVGNGGHVDLEEALRIELRAGSAHGRTVVATTLGAGLPALAWTDVELTLMDPEDGLQLFAVVETTADQCRDENDGMPLPFVIGPDVVTVPEVAPLGPALRLRDASRWDDPTSFGTLDWSLDEGLPRPSGQVYQVIRGTDPSNLDVVVTPLGHVDREWREVTERPPTGPRLHFYRVRPLHSCDE